MPNNRRQAWVLILCVFTANVICLFSHSSHFLCTLSIIWIYFWFKLFSGMLNIISCIFYMIYLWKIYIFHFPTSVIYFMWLLFYFHQQDPFRGKNGLNWRFSLSTNFVHNLYISTFYEFLKRIPIYHCKILFNSKINNKPTHFFMMCILVFHVDVEIYR